MAENSKIEWTDHTFNPWWGCTPVSSACDFCYAEALSKRFGKDLWGNKPRQRTSAQNWNLPRKWNRQAEKLGIRYRVFCASMADVFDNQVPTEWRDDLWQLIRETPHLDWLLLTKRPQNIAKMLPPDWGDGYPNVWLGMTAENQTELDRRIGHLLTVPAVVRFLSCEPLLGPIDLSCVPWPKEWYDENDISDGIHALRFERSRIHWVICGGESGPHARPMNLIWARQLRDQCIAAGVPFLFKQWGDWKCVTRDTAFRVRERDNPGVYIWPEEDSPESPVSFRARGGKKSTGRALDGRTWDEFPEPRILQENAA